MRLLSDLYNVTLKRGIRGKAKEGFVRPTIGQNFMTHRDFVEIDSNIGNDEYTKLLLHMDGEDGAKVFTDVSSSSHTVTPTASKTFTFTRPDGPDIGEGWTKNISDHDHGTISILNSKLRLYVSSINREDRYCNADSIFNLNSDFDVQVDFSSLNFGTVPTGSLSFICLQAVNGTNYLQIRLSKTETSKYYQVLTKKNGVYQSYGETITSDTTGKLRITKVGSTIAGHFWNGTGWTQRGSMSDTWNDLTRITMAAIFSTSDAPITVDFDNLQINSGTLINYPSPITKTDVKKFGTASSYFGGDVSYLEIPNSEDFNFGNGDFTIDFWVNFEALNTVDGFDTFLWKGINSYSNISIHVDYHNTTKELRLVGYQSGTSSTNVSIYRTWEPTLNTWYHITVVRNNNIMKLFVNGEQLGLDQSVTGAIDTTSHPLYIGHRPAGVGTSDDRKFRGYMDELRISKGIARWTENFTPPTRSYT